MELEKKIQQAIRLLQSYKGEQPIEVAYSGGKDSDVILELAKMAGINYRAIYKCTTIDPPHTIAHCKSKGVEIMKPKEKFFDLVKRNGLPNRSYRFCCKYLKEYKILDNAIHGIRRSESIKRAQRYSEPVACRTYGSKSEHVNVYLPILDWSDEDVEKFIAMRGIKCHPLYYDEQGNFHVERRLGCIGCPLASRHKRVVAFIERPKFLKRLIYCAKIHWEGHPNMRTRQLYKSIYEKLYREMFCNSYSDFIKKTQRNLFGEEFDAKAYLEKYFNIEL